MTAQQAKKLKPGDKVIPRYDAFEINLGKRAFEQTVEYVEYDSFYKAYFIKTKYVYREHKRMDLVK